MQYNGGQYNGAAYAAQPAYAYSGQYYQQQPQPIQHQYSGQQQQQQQYVSTPYAGNVPFPQPSPYTAPPALQQAPSQPPTHRPPRTQTPHPHRRHTTTGGSKHGHSKPLRSAMRHPERSSSSTAAAANAAAAAAATLSPNPVAAPNLLRARTHSGAAAAVENRSRLNSISRTRTNSSSRVDPDHIFLSVNAPNELEVSNLVFQNTIEELRERIFPMWPSGIAHQSRSGSEWRVKFVGRPWDAKGHESIMAQRMICRIFWVFATQGYVYLTSINTGRAPAARVHPAPVDVRAHFFAMSLNNSGDRVLFVDPPAAVANSLGLSLRAAFPHSIVNEQMMGADKNLFLAHILKYINDMAFKLDASVPLARHGLLGLGGRKELWVFKGSESWWSTRK
ncbi:hypothetical protein BC834DRAFT_1037657 [Gloeopeniophorella convolvens]|nr:hypothetical protein BC834DRAFT_1037657 [Gloeopeniophorella convolvens]